MVRFTLRPLHPRGNSPGSNSTAGWVGTTAGLDASQQRLFSLPEIERSFLRFPAFSPVCVWTALRLLHVVLDDVAGGIIWDWNEQKLNKYINNSMEQILLDKLTMSQLVKKLPAFYGSRKYITAFTRIHHLFLFWTRSIQFMPPYSTSWKSILILSSHLGLGLPSGLCHSSFLTKTLYASRISPIRATCPAQLLLDLITWIIFREYRS